MISCGYNGWTDLPEEEREALEAFEASRTASCRAFAIRAFTAPPTLRRKAA